MSTLTICEPRFWLDNMSDSFWKSWVRLTKSEHLTIWPLGWLSPSHHCTQQYKRSLQWSLMTPNGLSHANGLENRQNQIAKHGRLLRLNGRKETCTFCILATKHPMQLIDLTFLCPLTPLAVIFFDKQILNSGKNGIESDKQHSILQSIWKNILDIACQTSHRKVSYFQS